MILHRFLELMNWCISNQSDCLPQLVWTIGSSDFSLVFYMNRKLYVFGFAFSWNPRQLCDRQKWWRRSFPFVFLRFLEFGEHLRNKRMNRKNKKGRNQLVDDIFSFCLPPPPLKEMLLCLCVSACGVDVSRCGLFNNNKKKSRKNVKMKTERDKSKTTALKDGTRCFVDILEQMQHLEKKKRGPRPNTQSRQHQKRIRLKTNKSVLQWTKTKTKQTKGLNRSVTRLR